MTDNNTIALTTLIITGVLSAMASLFAYLKSASADKKADHIKVAVDGNTTALVKKVDDLQATVLRLTGEKAASDAHAKGVALAPEVERQVAARTPPVTPPAALLLL